jgi:hypothetical protein
MPHSNIFIPTLQQKDIFIPPQFVCMYTTSKPLPLDYKRVGESTSLTVPQLG